MAAARYAMAGQKRGEPAASRKTAGSLGGSGLFRYFVRVVPFAAALAFPCPLGLASPEKLYQLHPVGLLARSTSGGLGVCSDYLGLRLNSWGQRGESP